MTNGEHYKTVEARTIAFRQFCTNKICKGKGANCILSDKIQDAFRHKCEFAWLDLEYKEEMKPCPFCGCAEIRIAGDGNYALLECSKCRVGTGWRISENDAIEAWNRRVK